MRLRSRDKKRDSTIVPGLGVALYSSTFLIKCIGAHFGLQNDIQKSHINQSINETPFTFYEAHEIVGKPTYILYFLPFN